MDCVIYIFILSTEWGSHNIIIVLYPQIYHVDRDSLAAKSGLSEGDEILAVNGTKVYEPFHCITKLMCCLEHGVSIYIAICLYHNVYWFLRYDN